MMRRLRIGFGGGRVYIVALSHGAYASPPRISPRQAGRFGVAVLYYFTFLSASECHASFASARATPDSCRRSINLY